MEKLRELVFRLCGEPGLPGEEKSAAALLALGGLWYCRRRGLLEVVPEKRKKYIEKQ